MASEANATVNLKVLYLRTISKHELAYQLSKTYQTASDYFSRYLSRWLERRIDLLSKSCEKSLAGLWTDPFYPSLSVSVSFILPPYHRLISFGSQESEIWT